MTSKELVKATVEFGNPERITYLPVIDIRRFKQKRPQDLPQILKLINGTPQDIIVLEPIAPPGSKPTSNYCAMVEDGEDMWGVIWRGGYAIRHPLAESDFDLEGYEFPNPNMEGLFAEAEKKIIHFQDRYLLGMVWWTLFERMHLLRGFNNALTDHLRHPKKFRILQERIFEYDLAILDHWIELGVDGIFFSDDWGHQKGLLVEPKVWRKLWKPYYAELFKRVREHDMHVWLHSCGNIMKIIPDLIELGLHVLNPIQPQAMDIEELARCFKGKLCFYGGVDVQRTLPYGRPEDVKREVEYLVHTLGCFEGGRFKGGYIGGVSHSIIPDVPLENIVALYEAFAGFSTGGGKV